MSRCARLWPRSLAGQMALLIALALFVAQAINFGADPARSRASSASRRRRGPVATRIADALDREAHGGRPLTAERGRVRRVTADPIPPAGVRARIPRSTPNCAGSSPKPGVTVGRIDTGLRPSTATIRACATPRARSAPTARRATAPSC